MKENECLVGTDKFSFDISLGSQVDDNSRGDQVSRPRAGVFIYLPNSRLNEYFIRDVFSFHPHVTTALADARYDPAEP